jgi:exo-1,4-beta-D-glucosaminidase
MVAAVGRGARGRTVRRAARAGLAAAALASVLCVAGLLESEAALAARVTVGLGGWQVQSSAEASGSGAEVSAPGFDSESWLAVRPDDAGAVGTEIGALLQNRQCPEVFFAENLKSCFGYVSAIGRLSEGEFAVPWWFRTNFTTNLQPGEHAQLVVNGIVGSADLWVNGTEVAKHSTLQGDYARYTFDVTGLLRPGVNSLALEVYPNDPLKMFTLDDVDWNQIPPDNNTGIQFPVELHTSGALAIEDVHVLQDDAPGMTSAALTPKAQVTNDTGTSQTGVVHATLTPPAGGGEPIALEKTVTLAAHESRTVSFSAEEDPRLEIAHPLVWWPYQMGAQPLYELSMEVAQTGSPPDGESEHFGIRTITSRLIGPSKLAPDGVRQFAVNGQPFVFRGGGWAEDLFLRYSAANTASQIALIENLGLDGIRTEGKQMPRDFYQQMDRAGILIDAGFQCCDAWQPEHAHLDKQDYSVLERSARSIGEQLRDHPSVMNFSWSDNAPTAKQEKVSLRGFAQAEFADPLVSSAEYKASRVLGPSGEKEGPYNWVPPSYWYDSTHYQRSDPTRTNVGGAWGFDSEASAGDTVPTIDSIDRFMSSAEQAALWQEPAYNQYHTNYEPELPNAKNGGYSFGTLYELDKAIAARYGPWSGLNQYVQEAQVANYETQRAEFEAYLDHSDAAPTPSTGIDYWMLNKGMPTLLWDLYNEEFDEAGSYFGAQEANRALHVLYAYDNGSVSVDNLTGAEQTGLEVETKVYSLAGELLEDQHAGPLSVPAQGIASAVITPKVLASTTPPTPAQTYFVELLLKHAGTLVDRNVYWLSTQPDVVDWAATVEEPQASMSQYADLTQLHELPQASVSVSAASTPESGPDGADTLTTVKITNTSSTPTVAFFLCADLRRGSTEGTPAGGDNEVLPVLWSENDTTLWPGESETLTVAYRAAELHGEQPVVSVSGWNVATVDSAAP